MDPKSRFDLSESVGRDELGEVFRATERDSGKNAAVKVFDAWAVANAEGRDTFFGALKALAGIRPARTPAVAAFDMDGDQGWIASRWVEGESLGHRIAEDGALDLADAAAVVCGLLDALDELHSTGQAHGGLSPNRVLLLDGKEAGGVVITDPFQHWLYSVSDPVRTSRNDPDRFLGASATALSLADTRPERVEKVLQALRGKLLLRPMWLSNAPERPTPAPGAG